MKTFSEILKEHQKYKATLKENKKVEQYNKLKLFREFEKDFIKYSEGLIKYEIVHLDNDVIFRLPEFEIDIVNLEQKIKKDVFGNVMYDVLDITYINKDKEEKHVYGLENLFKSLSGVLNDIPFFEL